MQLLINLRAIFRHPLNRDKRREYRRNQLAIKNVAKHSGNGQIQAPKNRPAETKLNSAHEALAAGDPYLAASLFEEAIGPDLEAASAYALDQYGVALAWIGRLDEAERALRFAFKKEDSAFVAYRFGSVLAEQRKFAEAGTVFAAIDGPQPWMAGGSTRAIRLPKQKDDLPAFDVPFRRVLDGLFDQSIGDRDFVYLVAADPRYVKQFARALHSSLSAVQANCLLHIHVINPDPSALRLLAYMKKRPGPTVAFSSEEVDLSGLSSNQRHVYYASARFFVLPALRRHYDKPVIVADIDQIVLKDPAPLIDPNSDVATIRFPDGRFSIMMRFSASVLVASSPASTTYFDRVAAYIGDRMRDPVAITWHLDQIALDVAHLVSDDIVLSELPQGAMLSAEPDADVPNNTYFWSVTYSIAENSRKLMDPIFQNLEIAPLIVVTPVFDSSIGLERTIASVARDRYSNVAHVMIDHRRAFDRPVDTENAGSANLMNCRPTEGEGNLVDLMRAMPNPIFVELPCGQELAQRTLLEIMLAIEAGAYRLQAPATDGSELMDLIPRVGLGCKGEQLRVFRKPQWPGGNESVRALLRPSGAPV